MVLDIRSTKCEDCSKKIAVSGTHTSCTSSLKTRSKKIAVSGTHTSCTSSLKSRSFRKELQDGFFHPSTSASVLPCNSKNGQTRKVDKMSMMYKVMNSRNHITLPEASSQSSTHGSPTLFRLHDAPAASSLDTFTHWEPGQRAYDLDHEKMLSN